MKKYSFPFFFIALLSLGGFSPAACGPANGSTAGFVPDDPLIGEDCRWNDFPLYGDVQFVESFPDIKVQIVNSFPDLKVKLVESFPDECGEWKIVEYFPDVKVQIVESFPDIRIQYVESFPGIPD
jgi:hypothetical protein